MAFSEPGAGYFPVLLWLLVLLDAWWGDPVYRFHPIRLIGLQLTWWEQRLFAWGRDGYGGGIILGLILLGSGLGIYGLLFVTLAFLHPALAWGFDLFLGYSLFALRDLEVHGLEVWRATSEKNLPEARSAVSQLVGRDVTQLDLAGCNRATLESLSENLSDGVISPLFWLFIGGIPGMLVFKIISTMDSMVGYRTERYLRFGWFGARADDLMNWIPARLTWLLLSVSAWMLPKTDAAKAWRLGWTQHHLLPGPNAGWGQATVAGALQVQLVGEKWKQGKLQHNAWIGDPADPKEVAPEAIRTLIVLNRCATLVMLSLLTLWAGSHWILS